MIIELRSLLPVLEEEENPQDPGKNSPGEKQEAKEAAFADVEIRSATPPRAPSPPPSGDLSFSASLPAGPLLPEISFPPASEGSETFRDDRIPELLERLLDAAERSAAFSEQIAGLMERQSSAPVPVYA